MSRIFVIAGEASGDTLAAAMLTALARQSGQTVELAGVGGPQLAALGLESLFPIEDLSIMGLVEVLPALPRLRRRLQQTVAAARAFAPDIVLSVDAPDFGLRVQRRLQDLPAIRVHTVAPSVWAWRKGRAQGVAQILDHLLCLWPFEPPFFTRHGLAATHIGHPILQGGADQGDGARARAHLGLRADQRVLGVLPGSRAGEAKRLLAPFREAVALLAKDQPDLVSLIPVMPHTGALIEPLLRDWPGGRVVTVDGTDVAAKYDAFAAMDAALAASGTVSLELAMAQVPHLVGYRMNTITAALVNAMLHTKYVNLINIAAQQEIIPELLQFRCRPPMLAQTVAPLLTDPARAQAQREAMAAVLTQMGQGEHPPAERAAVVLAGLINTKP